MTLPRPLPAAPPRAFLSRALAALGVAGLLGCSEAVQVYVGMRNLGQSVSWREALFSTLPSWLVLWVLLAPVLLLFRRYPLDRHRLKVALPVHVAAAAGFAGAHLAGTALFAELLLPSVGYMRQLSGLATAYFTVDVLTYAAIVGVFQLLHIYRGDLQRERVAAELSASLSEARLHALRSQLDPHFIFNALNAINALAQRGARDEIAHTVGSLAALFRESMRENTPQLVPLSIEMDCVASYLSLQSVRFPNRLSVETFVSADAAELLVPALALHALVEDAVTHRLNHPSACSLRVNAQCTHDRLRVDVQLRGAGGSGTGLDAGVAALSLRLQRLYGPDHRLVHDDTVDGTTITFEIPARAAATTPPVAVAVG